MFSQTKIEIVYILITQFEAEEEEFNGHIVYAQYCLLVYLYSWFVTSISQAFTTT